jgi:hypothetical protein
MLTGFVESLSARQREILPYLLLALAVFAAYANVYHNEFLLDDLPMIIQNEFLRDWNRLPDLLTNLTITGAGRTGGFYRPLQLLCYFFIYQAFGLSTVAFHSLNVLLQAVNAGLVYRLGRSVSLQLPVAFVGALLWAVHPLWTESVTYISGTSDLLFVFFCLAGLLALLPDFAPRRFWMGGLFFVLALCSKESAVVFPALASFTLFLTSKERLRPVTYSRTWPLWLVAGAYIIAWKMSRLGTFLMHDPTDQSFNQFYEYNFINRIFTALATLPTYLKLIIWPSGLHMERFFPVFTSLWQWPVLGGAVIVTAALWQIIWGAGRRGLLLSWGLLWFAAAQAPNTGIVKTLYGLVGEHWMYLPAIGLFLGAAGTAATWRDRQKSKIAPGIIMALLIVAALGLGIKTFLQNEVWHDPIAFYENIFRNGEDSGRAHNELGLYYYAHGDFDRAAEQFRAAIAHPAPMWNNLVPVLHNRLALIYLHAKPDKDGIVTPEEVEKAVRLTPQLSEATAELEKVVELDEKAYWANLFLSGIYDYRGNKEKAAFYKNQAEMIMQKYPSPN